MKTISTIISSFIILIVSLVWLVFLQNSSYATEIRLGIYNSYQWSLSIQPWEKTVQFWWDTRTNENTLWIIIWANTWSSYTITGVVPTISTLWSGIYQHNHTIVLQSTDWSQTLYGAFMRDTEPYSTTLNLMIDRSAPSIPLLLQPITNSVISSDVHLSRSPSIDNGIGVSHYRIHLSLDAGFLWETILVTSGTSLYINSNDLPIWTLFWYVEAIDYLWNNSNSIPSFFHHQTYSTIDEDPSDGGWAWIWNIDNNNDIWTQTWNTIQSGSIGQSGTIIDHNFTWDNVIITPPETDNTPTINSDTFSWQIIDDIIIDDPLIDNVYNDTNTPKENNWSSSSSYDPTYNYIIVSNSIDNNTSLSLKEYLISKYQALSLSQKWNLILPAQDIINSITPQDPDKNLYHNLINKPHTRSEPWIYQAITYLIQQKNPVYYVVQMIEFSFILITKLSLLLWL